MCQEKLRLLCHKETAKSPMAQVTYLRMRYAADLLTQDDLNVQQIGFLVGYENPFNFSLAFKRLHGLSPTHFRRLFREHYRQSPRDAHLAAKMRRACDDLVYSDLTITEIADRLGFTNVHNFSRAFRKAIGQPPSSYRAGRP